MNWTLHVVLLEVFGGRQPPPWVDEGLRCFRTAPTTICITKMRPWRRVRVEDFIAGTDDFVQGFTRRLIACLRSGAAEPVAVFESANRRRLFLRL
ncbi:MAG: hypothetical protein U0894_07665 [Pirellulales bacterium]